MSLTKYGNTSHVDAINNATSTATMIASGSATGDFRTVLVATIQSYIPLLTAAVVAGAVGALP